MYIFMYVCLAYVKCWNMAAHKMSDSGYIQFWPRYPSAMVLDYKIDIEKYC